MDNFTKKLWIFVALFCLILGAEIAVYIYEWNNYSPTKTYKVPKIKKNSFGLWLLDWDFGSYSSYIAIMLYTSHLK